MRHIGRLACLLALAGTAASAQGPVPPAPAGSRSVSAGRGSEVGRPFFTCYSPKEYGGSGQSWTFAQDDRGVIYVGNNLGLIEYDGASWRLIETAVRSVVRAIAKDAHGRLYVGSTGELGYLAPDQNGQLQYVSLLEHVKPEDRAFNDVWTAHATSDGIYFQAREILLRFTPKGDPTHPSGWTVRSWKPSGRFLYAFSVAGSYYVHHEGIGLQRMAGDELRTVAGSEQFAQERVHVLLPFGGSSDRPNLLLGTFNRGLFLYDGQSFQPFRTEIDAFLQAQTLYKATMLPDGALGLSTISGGAVILDPRTGTGPAPHEPQHRPARRQRPGHLRGSKRERLAGTRGGDLPGRDALAAHAVRHPRGPVRLGVRRHPAQGEALRRDRCRRLLS